MAARRLKLTVSYDGTEYHGWQVQPGLRTIQGSLEAVIAQIEGKPVAVVGSGRTDAGAHALAQVAACTLENPIPTTNLRRALNRLLPPDIRVVDVQQARPDFHPRYDAVSKTYEYRIWRHEICPPFLRRYVHHHPFPLNEARMMEAARLFEGTHDFSAFAAADAKDALGGSKVRTIFSSRVWREGEHLLFRVRGSGFLKHMVRNLAGALIEIGKGNMSQEALQALLEPACGRKWGHTLPARGLFLCAVEYREQGAVAGMEP